MAGPQKMRLCAIVFLCFGARPSGRLLSVSRSHHGDIFKNCTSSNLLQNLVEPGSARQGGRLTGMLVYLLCCFFFPHQSCRLWQLPSSPLVMQLCEVPQLALQGRLPRSRTLSFPVTTHLNCAGVFFSFSFLYCMHCIMSLRDGSSVVPQFACTGASFHPYCNRSSFQKQTWESCALWLLLKVSHWPQDRRFEWTEVTIPNGTIMHCWDASRAKLCL